MSVASSSPPSSVVSPRLMVLMFTDLVNSTAIKEQIGNQAYAQLLNRHDAFIRQALTVARGGRVLQDTGDGYFLSFESVAQAVSAALVFQWLMAAEAWALPFASRVGLHLGEVDQHTSAINEQDKFVGSAIDLASRVMSLARGGQILLTRAVFDAARQIVREHPIPAPMTPAPPLQWMAHGPYMFKGAAEPMDVFEVGAEGTAPLAPPPDTEKAKRHIRPGDEETLGWRPALGRTLESTTNWILVEKLGEGGFGEVWLAEQVKTASKRVFKFCFDPDRLRALKREVVLFRLLKKALGDRRDIAAVKEWQFERAPYFIELDYTPEGNLTQWAQKQGGIAKVPLQDRIRYVAEIANALAAAHSVGILHKDIKPSNVLMARDHGGPVYPRLTDFGIGILTDRSRLEQFDISQAGFTASNITMNDSSRTGTRMYTPPESLLDKPHTVQGDVYALGVLLYQMAVGDLARPLGVGWEREISDELLREDIAACVDVEPGRRLGSAAELAQHLETQKTRRQQHAARLNQARAVILARHRRTQVRLLGTALTLAVAVSVIIGFFWRDASNQRNEAASQRSAATREAAHARAEELRTRSTLAQIFVTAGWKDSDDGNVSLAMLRFAKALQTDASSSHRLRANCLVEFLPRLTGSAADWNFADDQMNRSKILCISGSTFLENIEGTSVDILDVTTGKQISPSIQQGGLWYAAFSPDGARVVTTSKDKSARVWNAATGKPITPKLEHSDEIWYAAFSPDGSRVVTASDDKTARVWDATTGNPVTSPLQHEDKVSYAAFSADGSRLVTASSDGTARIWDATTGKPLAPPLRHKLRIQKAAFSPDGGRVVTASDDGTARVWDAATGEALTPVLRHNSSLTDLEFSPDGRRVVTASNDKTARVWDAATGKPTGPPLEHTGRVARAAFSPDSNRVVTASNDKSARIWDAATGEPLSPPFQHGDLAFSAGFSPDGLRVMSRTFKNARVWDVSASKGAIVAQQHHDSIRRSKLSADGLRLAATNDDSMVRILDAATGRPLTPPLRHEYGVVAIAFSADGGRIVTGSDDKTARVWSATTGNPITPALKHEGKVSLAEFSSDGSRVVTASDDRTVRVWDATTGNPLTPPLRHDGSVDIALFSPDGRRLATSYNKDVFLWDAVTGKPLAPPMRHDHWVCQIAFSRDSSRVLTACRETIRVWDPVTGQQLTPPVRLNGDVAMAVFSHDNSHILTADYQSTARVWETATGKPLTPPLMHHQYVSHVAFSADDSRILTETPDELRVWDALTGSPISPSQKRTARGNAEFTADGSSIIFCADHKSYRWSLSSNELSDADLFLLAELTTSHHLDDTGALVPLTDDAWRSIFSDFSTRHPERFLPPPTQAVFDAEIARADPSRLKMYGEWFNKRGAYEWAAALLERARQSGASDIDSLLLARCHWMADEYALAASEFENVIATNKDPKQNAYFTECLTAVRREAAAPTTHRAVKESIPFSPK